MKKAIALLSVLFLLLSSASCAKESNSGESMSTRKKITDSSAETTSALPVTITVNNDNTETQRTTEITDESADVDIRLLNIFLSNFSELYCRNYSIDRTSTDKMIDFAILNAYYNYNDNFNDITPVEIDGKLYARTVSASYIKNRISRFFGVSVENKSTDSFYCDGTYYYYPAADGEFLNAFSKVTSIQKSGSGSYIVNYNIYKVPGQDDNVIDNKDKIYDGYGSENTEGCTFVGTGKAVLNEKYFGEGYANFTVVSLEHTVNG
jgi:hypothetical protein